MNFKKQIAFLFGGLALISYLCVNMFPKQEAQMVMANKSENAYLQVYLLDEDDLLVPLSIQVDNGMSDEEKSYLMFEYLSGKQKIDGYQALFNKECVPISIKINEGRVTYDFDDSIKNYDEENELKIVEAIVWGSTALESIDKVTFKMNNQVMNNMPLANMPLTELMDRHMGINHFESVSRLHDSNSVIVYYKKNNEECIYIPKTIRTKQAISSLEEYANFLLKDIKVLSLLSQPLSKEKVTIKAIEHKSGVVTIDLSNQMLASDQSLKEDLYTILKLSLSSYQPIKKLVLKVDGKIVKQEEIHKEEWVNPISF